MIDRAVMASILVSCVALAACGSESPLSPGNDSTNISGNYTFTVTASSACTQIPSGNRTRSYPAVVTQGAGGSVDISLTTAAPAHFTSGPAVMGTVIAGKMLLFLVAFGEEVTPSKMTTHIINGQSNTAVQTGSTISGNFSGSWQFLDNWTAINVTCNASDHKWTLVRR